MRNNAVKRLAMSALFLLAGMPFLLAQNSCRDHFGKGCFSASILSFKQDCMRQTPVSYKIDERLFGFIIAIKVIQQQSFSPERVSVKIILSRNVQRPLRRWLHRQSELLPDRLCTYQHHKKQKMEPSVYVSWSDLR